MYATGRAPLAPEPGQYLTTALVQGARFVQIVQVVGVVVVIFVIIVQDVAVVVRGVIGHDKRQDLGEVVSPGHFVAILVNLDVAHALQVGQLNRPQILAFVDLAIGDVQAAGAAQQASARSANLDDNVVIGLVFDIERHTEYDPFEAGFFGIHDFGQHRLAHVGAKGIGRAPQEVEFVGGKDKVGVVGRRHEHSGCD